MLPPQSRVFDWFTRHRAGVERVVDWFWYVLVAAVLVGVIAAFARRNRPATSLLPIPLALAALYVLFFAEARYHLPVAALLMPFAGAGLVWVGEAVRDLARFTIDRQRRPRLLYEGVLAAAAIVGLFVGWPRMLAAGTRLRDRAPLGRRRVQRRAAHGRCASSGRCVRQGPAVAGARDLGRFRDSPDAAATTAAATTDIDLPAGKYRDLDARGLRRPLSRRRRNCASAPTVSSCGACPGPRPDRSSRWSSRSRTPAENCTWKSESTEKICTAEDDVAALWIRRIRG